MATTAVQTGDVLNLAAPAGGVVSGRGYLIGRIFGVAVRTAAVGVVVGFHRKGVYALPKEAALAMAVGDAAFWDVANAHVDATPTGALIGRVVRAAIAADATVRVVLTGAAVGEASLDPAGPAHGVIADPGIAGAIPVIRSGICAMTSTGAGQTRTLAAPAFLGQEITLCHDVDGGSIVATVATGVNEAANTSLTFTDTRESIHLRAIRTAGALRWSIVGNDGVTVAP